jgi:diguanylate cyclase (GGDEF)-like protein
LRSLEQIIKKRRKNKEEFLKENLQILVVDDEQSIIDMLGSALSRLYSVKAVKSISEAIQILEDYSVDVLVSDLNLAGESGITLAKIARKNDPSIEIIFITGYSSIENAKIAVDLGVVAYMIKPIDILELFSAVEKAISSRRFNIKAKLYSETIIKCVGELDKHVKQIVSVYNLVQRINQTIYVKDSMRLIMTEISRMMNANALIIGVNCLNYVDIYAYSPSGILDQNLVNNLLSNFWKMEMSKAEFSLDSIRSNSYPLTLFTEESAQVFPLYGNSCSFSASITIFGENIGFIAAYNSINAELDEDHESAFNILPPLIAPAIYRGYLEKKSRHLATTDGLTGIANRRAFEGVFDKEITRSLRNKTNVSLIMMDIDWFKGINDNYGHIAGDDVLKKLTEVVGSIIRTYDFFARFGGEEFVVISPDSDVDGAARLSERIRDAIENTEVVSDDLRIKFTVSIGISTFSGESYGDLPINPKSVSKIVGNLIKNSDKAMYTAKQNNKNCVYYFDGKKSVSVEGRQSEK